MSTTISENSSLSLNLIAQSLGKQACQASKMLRTLHPQHKQDMLLKLATILEQSSAEIIMHNLKDIEQAHLKKYDAAFIDRLTLNEKRIHAMANGVRQIAMLPDIIGEISDVQIRPNGMQVGKMRMPIGVIAIIYESRPNVTIDAAALCFKSGNACILRGGSEALQTNMYLAELLKQCININYAVQVVPTADRAMITELIQLVNYIDVVIPRGGKGLIEKLMQESKIPMLKHLDGICHSYIDEFADLKQALDVCFNAKCQRYGTCNTMETLLIHTSRVHNVLGDLATLYASKQVELRCDEVSYAYLKQQNYPYLEQATIADWHTEYLAPVLAIKVVESLQSAIEHINTYSSKHTDAIITNNHTHAMLFLREIDSASVLINASTRLADGFEYGLGAEIGISNDKLHVRGPVGLEGLTNQKYIVFGHGEIRV
jgi:glutamate-5-semialdehyde dehydrogenase